MTAKQADQKSAPKPKKSAKAGEAIPGTKGQTEPDKDRRPKGKVQGAG